jgi:hypothetical protein
MASAILDRPDELSDDDLESELTIAASTRGRLRLERYERLLDEALLRGLVVRPVRSDDE